MPRKVKVVNINDDSTYGEFAEAIVENEAAETQEAQQTETQEAEPPKPKARAKRVPKPKAAVDKIAIEPEPTPEEVAPQSHERSEPPRRKWLNYRPWWKNPQKNRRR